MKPKWRERTTFPLTVTDEELGSTFIIPSGAGGVVNLPAKTNWVSGPAYSFYNGSSGALTLTPNGAEKFWTGAPLADAATATIASGTWGHCVWNGARQRWMLSGNAEIVAPGGA